MYDVQLIPFGEAFTTLLLINFKHKDFEMITIRKMVFLLAIFVLSTFLGAQEKKSDKQNAEKDTPKTIDIKRYLELTINSPKEIQNFLTIYNALAQKGKLIKTDEDKLAKAKGDKKKTLEGAIKKHKDEEQKLIDALYNRYKIIHGLNYNVVINQYYVLAKAPKSKEMKVVAVLKNPQAINIVNNSIAKIKTLSQSIKANEAALTDKKGDEKATLEKTIASEKQQLAQLGQLLMSYDIPINLEISLQPSSASVYLLITVDQLKSLRKK